MTNGRNWYIQIKTAEELELNPPGVYYAELYERGEMHPLSVGQFEKCANDAVKKIIDAGLLEEANRISIKFMGIK